MELGTDWIAVDWGTSNLRAWGIDAGGGQTFAVRSDRGMGRLTRPEFAPTLVDLLAPEIGDVGPVLDVVICGMAGARQGWLEAPYLEAPVDLGSLSARAVRPEIAGRRLLPRILPGVCQRHMGEEDVMRGEETQLLGLSRLYPGFAGTVILPGTHSKWVAIDGRHLDRFSTAMTGELFELLATHSVLRHSLLGERDGPANDAGVAAGLDTGLAHPERLLGDLFKTRAASLLSDRGPDWCAGYLSGLLIGAEVGGHRDWLGAAAVPLIGSAKLVGIYAAALQRLGVGSFAVDAAAATLAGLTEARMAA